MNWVSRNMCVLRLSSPSCKVIDFSLLALTMWILGWYLCMELRMIWKIREESWWPTRENQSTNATPLLYKNEELHSFLPSKFTVLSTNQGLIHVECCSLNLPSNSGLHTSCGRETAILISYVALPAKGIVNWRCKSKPASVMSCNVKATVTEKLTFMLHNRWCTSTKKVIATCNFMWYLKFSYSSLSRILSREIISVVAGAGSSHLL